MATAEQDDIDLQKSWEKACASFLKTSQGQYDLMKGSKANLSPQQVIDRIIANQEADEKRKDKHRTARNAVDRTAKLLLTLANLAGPNLSNSFPLGGAACSALGFLIEAGQKYHKLFESIADLFSRVSDVLYNCSIYLDMPKEDLDPRLRRVVNEILLNFVSICEMSVRVFNKNAVRKFMTSFAFSDDQGVQAEFDKLKNLAQKELEVKTTLNYQSTRATQRTATDVKDIAQAGFKRVDKVDEKIDLAQRQRDQKNIKKSQIAKLVKLFGEKENKSTAKSHYDELKKTRVSKSGSWLKNVEPYNAWMDKDSNAPPALFLCGKEGHGKSYLTTSIIRDLEKRYHKPAGDRTMIAYFFFGREKTSATDPRPVTVGIKGIMWKLVENDVFQKEFVSAWGEETFDETEDEHTNRLLEKIAATSKRVAQKSFFLFDGIDQLDEKRTLGKRGKHFMKLLEDLMADSASAQSLRFLFTCTPTLRQEMILKLDSETLDLAEANNEDLGLFIDERLNNIEILQDDSPNIAQLRQDIFSTLGDNAGGDFVKVEGWLNDIESKRRIVDIREVLQSAESGDTRTDVMSREIQRLNDSLAPEDISDLNELLIWVIGGQCRYPVYQMDGALYLKNGSEGSSRVPLHERISKEFSSILELEDNEGIQPSRAYVKLKESLEEYFQQRSDDMKLQRSSSGGGVIQKSEVKIVKRFLNSVCDEELYNKFGFDEFFQQKLASDDATIYVNFEDMQIQILKRCLDVLRWDYSNDAYVSNLDGYAALYFQIHLGRVDLSLSDPDTKQQVGELLLPVLTEDGCIGKWWNQWSNTLREWWLYDENELYVNNVARWLSDTAVTRSENIDEDARHWAEKFKSSSSSTSNFVVLEKVAEYMATQWLDGRWTSGDNGPFAFLHSYLSKLRVGPHSKTMDPVLEDPTPEMDIVHIYESKNWAMKEFDLGVEESEAIRNVGRTLRELGHYDEAIVEFKRSAEMMEDNWLPLWGLAGTYELQGEFKLAIETLEPVMEKVESGEAKTDDAVDELRDMLFDLGQWNVNIEKQSRGLELFHRILEKQNPKDAGVVFEIVTVHQQQSAFQETMALLKRLDDEHDDTENCSRLICVILDLVGGNGVWEETVLDAARLTGNLPFLRQKCEDALEHAKLKLKKPEDLEDSLVTSLASLYLQYGCLLYQYPIDENDAAAVMADETRTIELWEEIIRLCKTYNWNSDLKYCARETCRKLSYVYMDRGRREKNDSEQSQVYLDKLRVLGNTGENSYDIDLNASVLESLYHSKNENIEKARETLLPAMKDAFDLLSDDDPSNDWIGYLRLSAYLSFIGDDKNSVAAYKLITPKYFTGMEQPIEDTSEDDSDEEASTVPGRESQGGEDEVEEEQEDVGEEETSDQNENDSLDGTGEDDPTEPVAEDQEEPDETATGGKEETDELSSQQVEDAAAEQDGEDEKKSENDNGEAPSESPTSPITPPDPFSPQSGPLGMECDMNGCPRTWGFMSDVHHCLECLDVSFCSEHLMIVRGRKGRWAEGVWVEEDADPAAEDVREDGEGAEQKTISNGELGFGSLEDSLSPVDADTTTKDDKTITRVSTAVNGIQLKGRKHFAVTCRASHTFLSVPPYDENEVGRVKKAAANDDGGSPTLTKVPAEPQAVSGGNGNLQTRVDDRESNMVDGISAAYDTDDKGEEERQGAAVEEGLAQVRDQQVRPPTKDEVLVAGEIIPIKDWIEGLKAEWGIMTSPDGGNESQVEGRAEAEGTAEDNREEDAEETTAGEDEE
ncbi:MAG: hypothetical protein M1831_001529 [Alyxoria varia]|nr:MAG: hypothetical protein M1831_001529 [Alyxoria varia]